MRAAAGAARAGDVELPYGVLGRLMGKVGQRGSKGHVREMLAKLKAPAEA